MCGHANGTIDEMVEAAVELGLNEIGIADHMPLFYFLDPQLAMAPEEVPLYVERVLEVKESFTDRIVVRLGIEADYDPATMEERVRELEKYPWDYVIGSVHILNGWVFDDPRALDGYEGLDIDQFYIDYLATVEDMVDTGIYDIVGHVDLAKKFDFRPTIDLSPYYRKILEKMAARGTCYEVNSAGLRWPAKEMYPAPQFIETAASMRVPVTLGSDAHTPADVARDFDKSVALIKAAGYDRMAFFEGRKMRLEPLD